MAVSRKRSSGAGWPVLLIPYAWLVLFFLIPFLIVLKISLSATAIAQPPYTPVFDPAAGVAGLKEFLAGLSLDNYAQLIADTLYVSSYLRSLEIAALSTVILLVLGYPVAYGMARAPRRWRGLLLVLVILPFWTSFLIRIYAWIHILPHEAVLKKMDESLLEAAADLGAPRWKTFWLVTLPLSRPGIVAGVLLCFIPIVGEFVAPDLLGGSQRQMIGQTLWTEFFSNRDWPLASSVAVVLLLLLVIPIVVYQHQQAREIERG